MTFYGPTFPNETHYETLLNGRQRFGNRSANMFFVRPARHIACPRRLKYIHDIKTGYIPYVEDSSYVPRTSYRYVLPKSNGDETNKSNSLALYNSTDPWRQELMELAQQVKCSLVPTDEQIPSSRRSRSCHSNKNRRKRSSDILSNYNTEDIDKQNSTRILSNRRETPRSPGPRSRFLNDKNDAEQNLNEGNQDPGIWLIPILCYILQIDNIAEAQDWLVNANPTEKRLAMELISRTMQDMQHRDGDPISEISISDQSSTSVTNLNNVYWPYKIWQRQEKDRQQQRRQIFLEKTKTPLSPSLPTLTNENTDTCERGTSPLRMVTPAKRLPTASNNIVIIPEATIIEQKTSTAPVRQCSSQMTDEIKTVEKCSSPRIATAQATIGYDRPSRRSYRVKTSLSNRSDENSKIFSSTSRGKTPLI